MGAVAVSHPDDLAGAAGPGSVLGQAVHHGAALALGHVAEHHVLAVQPGGLVEGDEELGAVGVGAGVGHGEDVGAGVLGHEVLVLELPAVDAGERKITIISNNNTV